MPTIIRMPSFSATMEAAKLVSWLVAPGDTVAKGQVLAEVETDKAVATLESPGAGQVVELLVGAGDADIPVHADLAVLAIAGEAAVKTGSRPVSSAVTEAQRGSGMVGHGGRSAQRLASSPAARALARAHGVDLARITGSGPHGRIVKADVKRYVADSTRGDASRSPNQSVAQPQESALPSRTRRSDGRVASRASMARALTHAKTTVPHFYAEIDIQLDALLALRDETRTNGQRPPTVTAYLIHAAACALRDVPGANRYWDSDSVHQRTSCHIGCAVGLPDQVLVPVVRDPDQHEVAHIARELERLSRLAHEGSLNQKDFGDASLTISNLGMHGIDRFFPIINVPESMILGIGRARKVVGVVGHLVGIQTVVSCTVSIDHRALDGAVVGEYLQAFRKRIESPGSLPK